MVDSVGAAAANVSAYALTQRGVAAGGSAQAELATQQQLNALRSTDQKVRQHEQAHLSAAGGLGIGGASFQYQRGPDGKNYAVSGEVQIDVSPAQDPKSTLDKARRIQAAALAPSDPSPQDLAVAAAAAQMAAQAQAELRESAQNGENGATGADSANLDAATAAANADSPLSSASRDAERLLARALQAYAQPQQPAASLFHIEA